MIRNSALASVLFVLPLLAGCAAEADGVDDVAPAPAESGVDAKTLAKGSGSNEIRMNDTAGKDEPIDAPAGTATMHYTYDAMNRL